MSDADAIDFALLLLRCGVGSERSRAISRAVARFASDCGQPIQCAGIFVPADTIPANICPSLIASPAPLVNGCRNQSTESLCTAVEPAGAGGLRSR